MKLKYSLITSSCLDLIVRNLLYLFIFMGDRDISMIAFHVVYCQYLINHKIALISL